MDLAQIYESTVYDRESGQAFGFVTVPGRSMLDGIQTPDAVSYAERLGLEEPRFSLGEPLRIEPVEAWAVPFLIDAAMGRSLADFEWPFDRFFIERLPRGRRRRGSPSEFAQYVTFAPVIPFESSPLGPKALAELITAGGGAGMAIGAYTSGHPLLLLVVPAGIIIGGAATGIAEALRIGLRTRLLQLMGVQPSQEQTDEPPEG